MHLHWDGDNDSVDERNLSAALGAGVTPVTVDHAAIRRVRDWIWTLPPPAYPYPIDKTLAARGARSTSSTACVPRRPQVQGRREGRARAWGWWRTSTASARIGIGSIRTRRRLRHQSVRALSRLAIPVHALPKTDGYANQPLDGIWLRGPYLHNGSVPTLRDLLEPPERRPAAFFRGYDVFDQHEGRLRLERAGQADGRRFFRYDTSVPGNGNGGHVYGTTLPDADKQAIVEYLKTF